MNEEWNMLDFFAEASAADVACWLKGGGDINARGKYGWTPLHMAAAFRGEPAVVEALLAAGADPNTQDEAGQTPLHMAAKTQGPEVIRTLLDNDSTVDVQDKDGKTPLHEAVAYNEQEDPAAVVKVLLAAGADPNTRCEHQRTLLHEAARLAPSDVIEALLDHGADRGAEDRFGNLPWDYAKDRGEAEGREHLRVNDVCWRLNPTFEAALDGNAGINAQDRDGMTLLHWAAKIGSRAVVKRLLDAGADPSVEDSLGYLPWDYVMDRYDLPRHHIDRRLFDGRF